MAEPYKHQDFPKAKYHKRKPHVIVKDAEEETKLGDGWQDKPFDSNTSHLNHLTVEDMKREAKELARFEGESEEQEQEEDESDGHEAPTAPVKRGRKKKEQEAE